MKLVENSILSTDLAMYFKKKNRFMEVVENGEFDWQSEEKKAREFCDGIVPIYNSVRAPVGEVKTPPLEKYNKLKF